MARRPRITVLLAVLLPIVLVLGIYAGGHPSVLPDPIRDTLVDDSDARLYQEALDIIAEDYYRPVDRDRLLNRSLDSAVEELKDRFSAYFDPRSYQDFRESTEGAFEGVGMNVEEVARGLRVINVFKGSPADNAGIEPGDVIVAADGRSLRGKSSDEAIPLIKGKAGTSVRLTVRSDGNQREVRVKRERVEIPVVESRMVRHDNVSYAHVTLSSFTSGAHGEVGDAVRGLIKRGAKGVVLDLRDNGGGLLQEAVLVSSIFIPEGTIVTTRGRSRPPRTFEASGRSIDTDIPVVVLVNKGSASASEIVTAALQDRKRAKIVGTETFGKGVFQEIKELSNGGALDITVGEYFTPSGRNLGGGGTKRGKGITPDVEARDRQATPKRDEALDVALDTVHSAT